MKRKRQVFDALKASEALQDAKFSVEQANRIVRVIQDSQEHAPTFDDLQESERTVTAEANAHADELHAEAMVVITSVKKRLTKFLTTVKVAFKTILIALGVSVSVAAIVYYVYSIIRG